MPPVRRRDQFHQLKVSTVLHCSQPWFEEGREVHVPESDRRRSTTAAQESRPIFNNNGNKRPSQFYTPNRR
jgi:hypothetical protein